MKKQVYTAENPVDARFVKGLLDSHGIMSEIREEGMIGDYPSVWVSAGVAYELAKRVISALTLPPADTEITGELRICVHCGESVEIQFTECWHCGTAQPSV